MEATGKIKRPAWMVADETIKIMEAISHEDCPARFVGGCVRDALLNRKSLDVDIATPLLPDELIKKLKLAEIKYVPTGIEHGTVTAVVNGKPFEITTLRRDVETHGRHATVEFTDDWLEDARRRDFTINAIFCDLDGTLYDPFNGVEDLRCGRINFVGDAATRIQEDVLRILRFFRFYAHYGQGEACAEGVEACAEFAHLIPGLSIERVQNEILKLLEADMAARAWELMAHNGIMSQVLPSATDIQALDLIIRLEAEYDSKTDRMRRLAAVLMATRDEITEIGNHFKLSNDQKTRLALYVAPTVNIDLAADEATIRKYVYELGNDAVRTLALVKAAKTGQTVHLSTFYKYATRYRLPLFPVTGDDVMKLGIASGPQVGELLKQVEAWWAENDFQPGRRECLTKLNDLVQA